MGASTSRLSSEISRVRSEISKVHELISSIRNQRRLVRDVGSIDSIEQRCGILIQKKAKRAEESKKIIQTLVKQIETIKTKVINIEKIKENNELISVQSAKENL